MLHKPGFAGALKRHPISFFYALAMILALAFVPVIIFTGWDAAIGAAADRHGIVMTTSYVTAWQLVAAEPSVLPGVMVAVLQPLSPDIAAFIVATFCFGSAGFWALLRRYRFRHPGVERGRAMKLWIACILSMTGISLATGMINYLLLPPEAFIWAPRLDPAGLLSGLLVAMFLDGGGVAEETGWRGFALPLFQSLYPPIRASIILGVVWTVWHMPVKIDILLTEGPTYYFTYFTLLTVRLTLLSLFIAYFYNGVGGSTLIAIAMHGLHNDSWQMAGTLTADSFTIMLRSETALIIPLVAAVSVVMYKSSGKLNYDAALSDFPRHPRAQAST